MFCGAKVAPLFVCFNALFLHKKFSFTKNNIKVFILFSILSFLQFLLMPYFFTIFAYYDFQSKRLNFCVCFFGKLRIFGGYIKRNKTNLIVHFSNDKAFAIGVKALKIDFNSRSVKAFKVLMFKTMYCLDEEVKSFFKGAVYAVACSNVFPKIIEENKKAKLDYSVNIKENNVEGIFFKFKFVTSVILVIISQISKVWGNQ